MAFEIVYSRAAARRLRRSGPDLRARLIRKINEIAEDPDLKGSTPLQDDPRSRRVRVGGWRIIYTWDAETLYIEAIGSRGQVYKDFNR